MQEFLHIFTHTLEHTATALPFLFGAYLLIEFIEHRHAEKFASWLSKFGKAGAAIGALLGIVPQCGFSVVAANLYSNRIITAGTMFAVFISTSDEAIPVLLSNPESAKKILPLIGSKLILAIVAGFLVDRFGLLCDPRSFQFLKVHKRSCVVVYLQCAGDGSGILPIGGEYLVVRRCPGQYPLRSVSRLHPGMPAAYIPLARGCRSVPFCGNDEEIGAAYGRFRR